MTTTRNYVLLLVSLFFSCTTWAQIDTGLKGQRSADQQQLTEGTFEAASDQLPYQQALPLVAGRYFQLLQAKNYEQVAPMIMAQEKATAPFLQAYKSLDNEETMLVFQDYKVGNIPQLSYVEDKQYTAFPLQITIDVKMIGETVNEKQIAQKRALFEKMYPNEVSYDAEKNAFTINTYLSVLAGADQGKNNWSILPEDPLNGLSIRQNISKELQLAVGFD
jgi:hypothetical protein